MGGGAELQRVGERGDLPLVAGMPNHDAAQQARTIGLDLRPGEANDLVGEDTAFVRDRALFHEREGGIVFEAGDGEDARHGPAAEQGVIRMASVHGHNGTPI